MQSLRSALSATKILLEQVTIKETLAQLAGAIEAIMVFPDDLVICNLTLKRHL